jgi:hypothetical protein
MLCGSAGCPLLAPTAAADGLLLAAPRRLGRAAVAAAECGVALSSVWAGALAAGCRATSGFFWRGRRGLWAAPAAGCPPPAARREWRGSPRGGLASSTDGWRLVLERVEPVASQWTDTVSFSATPRVQSSRSRCETARTHQQTSTDKTDLRAAGWLLLARRSHAAARCQPPRVPGPRWRRTAGTHRPQTPPASSCQTALAVPVTADATHRPTGTGPTQSPSPAQDRHHRRETTTAQHSSSRQMRSPCPLALAWLVGSAAAAALPLCPWQ